MNRSFSLWGVILVLSVGSDTMVDYCVPSVTNYQSSGLHNIPEEWRSQTTSQVCITSRKSEDLITAVEGWNLGRGQLKCDGTRSETRFRLSAKRTSPFKSARASVHSTTGSRSVRISFYCCGNAGYTMFRGSVKGIGYQLHSPVSPSFPLPCVTVCHHIQLESTCRLWAQYILINIRKGVPSCTTRFFLQRWLVSAHFSGRHQTYIPEPMKETI